MIGKVTVNTMLPCPDERVKSLFATEEKENLKSLKFKTSVRVMSGL
jgi:hypothetical protein